MKLIEDKITKKSLPENVTACPRHSSGVHSLREMQNPFPLNCIPFGAALGMELWFISLLHCLAAVG